MATSGALSTSNQYVKYTITVTQNSQNVANNTSNVTVSVRFYRTNTGYTTYGTGTVYCKINGTTYSAAVTPSQKITNSGIVLFTKTLNISHNSDGTKTLNTSAWISHNAPLTSSEQSYNQALTTIPRASSLTASNGTLEVSQNLTINRASSNFTHTITYKCGTASGTVATKTTATTVEFTPPDTLARENTIGTAVTVAFTLTTYSGNTVIGTATKTITCAIPTTDKYLPSISAVTFKEKSDIVPSGFPFVKSKSKIGVTVTASGKYGASVTVKCEIDDLMYNGTLTGSDVFSQIVSNTITHSGEVSVVTTVTDSRGRQKSRVDHVTVLDYTAPKVSCSAKRCDANGTIKDTGEYMKVTYSATITALNNANARSYYIKYKKSTDTKYTTFVITSSAYSVSGAEILPADSGSSYDVEFYAADSFAPPVKKSASVPTANVIFHIGADGKSFSFFKVSELEGLEIEGDLFVKGGASMFNPVLVANGTDFNELRDAGWYYGDTNVNTESCLNIPEKKSFYMCVCKMPSKGRLLQLFITFDAKAVYMRYYREWGDAPAWLDWEQVTGNVCITASGENTNYSYRRYSDGTQEVSGKISYTSLACNTALGDWYRTAVLTPPNYPVAFSELPAVTMSFDTSAGTGALVWETDAGTVNRPPTIYLIRPTSSTAVTGSVNVMAKGRWE